MLIVTFDENTAKNVAKSYMADYAFEASANKIYLDTARLTEKQVSDINAITKKYEISNKSLLYMVCDGKITKKQYLKKAYRLKSEYERKWKGIVATA